MTTLALPNRWTFGGYDLSSYAIIVPTVVGADDLPPIRGENAPWTGRSGRQYLPKLLDSRRVALTMTVLATDAAGTYGGRAQARTNLDALYAALVIGSQATLARLMLDGSTRTGTAEVVSVNGVTRKAGEVFILVVQFELADPYWYGPSSTGPGSQTTTTSPKDFTFTQGGNATSQRVAIDVTGAITNFRLTNQTTGTYVEYIGAVASTKHLLLDAYTWTATNDGALVIPGHNASLTPWMTMAPGVNSMRVTSTVPGGSVVVTAYPAWL